MIRYIYSSKKSTGDQLNLIRICEQVRMLTERESWKADSDYSGIDHPCQDQNKALHVSANAEIDTNKYKLWLVNYTCQDEEEKEGSVFSSYHSRCNNS